MSDLESDRIAFDQKTQLMAEVFDTSTLAPPEHSDLYLMALSSSYADAFEFLKDKPELAKSFQALGLIAVFASDEQRTFSNSLNALERYADRGLIDSPSLDRLKESKPVMPAFPYTAWDFEAYETLFGGRLADLVVEQNDTEESVEVDLPVYDQIEAEDKEDIGDEINILDVMEHMERKGFSSSEIAFVEQAMGISPTTISKLRGKVFEVMQLSGPDFKLFKDSLLGLRQRLTEMLSDVGIESKWVILQSSKIEPSYQLLLGREAEKANEPDPRAGLKEAYGPSFGILTKGVGERERIERQPRENTPAVEKLSTGSVLQRLGLKFNDVMSAVGDVILGGEDRHNMIAKVVAERFNISRLEARAVIQGLFNDEKLFRNGKREQHSIISLERPDPSTLVSRRGRRHEVSSDKDTETEVLTVIERKLVPKLFEALISVRYQSRGMTIQNLSKEMNYELEATRKICNKLVKQGALISLQRYLQSGKARQKKNRVGSFIMFPTQQHWDNYREDPKAYMGQIRVEES